MTREQHLLACLAESVAAALAQARAEGAGRDVAVLKAQAELMDEVFEALSDERGRCFCVYSGSGGTVRLCRFHQILERIDNAIQGNAATRAEKEGGVDG